MDARIAPQTGSDTAGFTLVELLVTVAVLAVLAVGASLAASRGGGGGSAAGRFERSFEAARHLAVSAQQMRGIRVTAHSFQPVLNGPEGWQALGRESRWQERVSFAARSPGLPGDWPEIVFLPDGRTSAFAILFGAGQGGVACESDGLTGLRCAGM